MKGSFVKLFYALLTTLFLLLTTFSWATRGTETEVKCIERERQALLIFKKGILEDYHDMMSTWRDHENGDCCNWNGVRCSNETGHVQILHLRGSDSQHLRGTINFTSFIELHDLKHLDLSNNYFGSSDIPKFIDSFTHLRYLNLSYSYFGGNIPYQLGKLSHLRYLDLSGNFLDEAIPYQLGNLSKLQYLNLEGNSLVGTIPYQLGNLSNLQYLNFEWNSLVGTIPYQLGNLSKLQYLNLEWNSLVGAIPYQLGNLSMLHSLELGYNSNLTMGDGEWLSKLSSLTNLDLSIVSSLGYSLHWLQMIGNLRELRLRGCDISMPNSLLNFSTSLVILDLSESNFNSAKLQWMLNSNSNLQELYLADCNLAADDITFQSYYFQDSSLAILDLSDNNLKMSTWKMNFTSNLQELYLSNCSLSSHNLFFTPSSSNLSSLVILDLSFNQLTSSALFHLIFNFTSNLHRLDLQYNMLKGPIPYEFGNMMKSLEYLDLSLNELQGEIPMSLGNICTLKRLDLSTNNLSGELSSFIPNSSWCNRHSLQTLDLHGNQITGMLPDLSIFSSLVKLRLSYNQLDGEIHESIGMLHELQELFLNGNSLKGLITESHFRNLSNLKIVSLSHNSLALKFSNGWVPPFQLNSLELTSCKIGPNFPNWLQTQNKLRRLDISNVEMSSDVPEWFWALLENMEFMNMSSNNFIGEIPNLLLKLQYKPKIIMTSNNFEGAVPLFLSQSSELRLSENKFSNLDLLICGKTEDEELGILDVSKNQLKGQLPDCWSRLHSLTFLDLSNNNLSGEIPPSLGSLVNMEALVLRNNSLNGELPKTLKNCTQLILLDVSNNKLVGPLPLWIGESLQKLKILSLRVNRFSGSIPLHLCHLTQIQILDLSQNSLANEIPTCFKNFTVIAQDSINFTNVGDHSYRFNGTSGYATLSYYFDLYITLMWKGVNGMFKRPDFLLKSIDLSNNSLTGEIPKELVSLFGLISLNLSRNNLFGKIPSEIGNLQSLEFLDLSRNQLSGIIPPSLAHIDRLAALDLSHNNLFGQIPTGTQLQSFNASSYEGNPDLCGMPLENCQGNKPTSPQVFDKEDENSLFSPEFYMSLGLGFPIGFWVFLSPMLFNRSWRHAYCRLLNNITNSILKIIRD